MLDDSVDGSELGGENHRWMYKSLGMMGETTNWSTGFRIPDFWPIVTF